MMKKIVQILSVILLTLSLGSCTFIKKKLDQSGIDDISAGILADFKVEDREELENYLREVDFRKDTHTGRLEDIKTEPLENWLLDGNMIQEKINFPSPLRKENGEPDTAGFYLYRNGDLKNQKVIIWIPGFGVSDFAFRFIKRFFYSELNAGYAVLFYNIPYHLERIEQGREMGEGYFTSNNRQNLEMIRFSLYEIRTAVKYLNHKGVSSISGWGGSIGGALLWLSSSTIEFDHLTLMIPIVDWNTIIFNPRMSEVVSKMRGSGISESLIRSAYNRISPFYHPTKTDPDHIQLLYARHDLLTPEAKILEFTEKWHIKNVHGYDESHASILINSRLYKENKQFLEKMKKDW